MVLLLCSERTNAYIRSGKKVLGARDQWICWIFFCETAETQKARTTDEIIAEFVIVAFGCLKALSIGPFWIEGLNTSMFSSIQFFVEPKDLERD